MIFWIEKGIRISYSDLVKDLNHGVSSQNGLDGYNYFFGLLNDLVEKKSPFVDIYDLQSHLINNSSDRTFIIETSGTTTKPKVIEVNLKNCIRQVKINTSIPKRIWGLCYPIHSFASTQVIFQAFLNCESIVYAFSKNFKEVSDSLLKESISNLACTPTFLNMIILNSNDINYNIKTITTGGEKLSKSLQKLSKRFFPNSKLINIYASTEAGSLLYSNSDIFKIPERYKEFIKIENNEIVIHNSLINNAKGNKIKGEWFFSGDEVEMIGDNQFIIKSRRTSYINTGGYRVDPLEIEEVLNSIDGVMDSRVYGKPNSILGTILCAEVISSVKSIKDIKLLLQEKIEKHKIPQIIKLVDNLSLTKSGKKMRRE